VPGGAPIALSTECRGKKGASCEAEVKGCGWHIFSKDTSSSADLALCSSVGFACKWQVRSIPRIPQSSTWCEDLQSSMGLLSARCHQEGVVQAETMSQRWQCVPPGEGWKGGQGPMARRVLCVAARGGLAL